jgi:hypothetical protein
MASQQPRAGHRAGGLSAEDRERPLATPAVSGCDPLPPARFATLPQKLSKRPPECPAGAFVRIRSDRPDRRSGFSRLPASLLSANQTEAREPKCADVTLFI